MQQVPSKNNVDSDIEEDQNLLIISEKEKPNGSA
jgi:hypothetical protein